MLNKVLLKIESTIDNLSPSGLPEGDAEKSVSQCVGVMHRGDGRTSLTYNEQVEGSSLRTEIICLEGQVEVVRSGAIESAFCFIEGVTTRSVYSIPPYKFDAEIRAKRVRVALQGCEGEIDLLYDMTVGGAKKAARMKIWISKALNQA